jgi:hypothetical protein
LTLRVLRTLMMQPNEIQKQKGNTVSVYVR